MTRREAYMDAIKYLLEQCHWLDPANIGNAIAGNGDEMLLALIEAMADEKLGRSNVVSLDPAKLRRVNA